MKRNNYLMSLVLVCANLNSFSQVSYKVIALNQNEISLSVPVSWEKKENAMKFSDYEIIYNVTVKDPKNSSGIALYVYKPRYGPKKQINDSIANAYKLGFLSDPIRKIFISDSGITNVSGISVGYFKYTFLVSINKKMKRAYGIDLFFCNIKGVYNRIEIKGLKRPIPEFKAVAETIFNSLKLK